MKILLLLLFMLIGLSTQAQNLEVQSAEALELRHEGDSEWVVLRGNPAVVAYGEDILEADRIEYLRAQEKVILSGHVSYRPASGEVINSEYLEFYVADESARALEVSAQVGQLDLIGPMATRIAGQVAAQDGYFTPCLQCGQDPPDYAFRAGKVLIYPGDRVVARDVEILIRGVRVGWIPVLLVHLSERRPRLTASQDSYDGFSVALDLPYITAAGLGFTLLRYYEYRGLGAGFDHWGAGEALEHYTFLYLPARVGESEPDLSYSVEYALEKDGWSRSLTIERDDENDPRISEFDLEVEREGEALVPDFRFSLDGYYDHDPNDGNEVSRYAVERLPELELAWETQENLGVDWSNRLEYGFYRAPYNPYNPSAVELAADEEKIQLGRLAWENREQYDQSNLWGSGGFSIENSFQGFYYDTAERQVDWQTELSLNQELRPFRLALELSRDLSEGENPFQSSYVDPPPGNSHDLAADFSARSPDFALSSLLDWDFKRQRYEPWELGLELSPGITQLNLDHERDLEVGEPLETGARIQVSPRPFSFSAQTHYDHEESRYDSPLRLQISYAQQTTSATLSHQRDLETGAGLSTSALFNQRTDSGATNLSETYDETSTNLSGNFSLTDRLSTYSLEHRVYFRDDKDENEYLDEREGMAELTLGYRYAAELLQVELSGEVWDDGRVEEPILLLGSERTTGIYDFDVKTELHLPEIEDRNFRLETASLGAGASLLPWLGVQGDLVYRYLENSYQDAEYELSLEDLGFTTVIAAGPSTTFYLSTFLNLDYPNPDEQPVPKPRYVFTMDRCCWAMRVEVDTCARAGRLAQCATEAAFSVIYGQQGAAILLDESGIRLPDSQGLP